MCADGCAQDECEDEEMRGGGGAYNVQAVTTSRILTKHDAGM
jgi:hypothetical protein